MRTTFQSVSYKPKITNRRLFGVPKLKKKKLNLQINHLLYFSATISSPRSNGAKITNYKPKGEQKIIFLSFSDKLNNSSWSRDIEISRTTSGLTSETKCKFTTLLCAPPQIFVVAKKTLYLQPEPFFCSNSFRCHYVKYPKPAEK